MDSTAELALCRTHRRCDQAVRTLFTTADAMEPRSSMICAGTAPRRTNLYNTLNRLSEAIGAHEDAWHSWRYRDNDGNVHPIDKLRDTNKITKRRKG
jgi:hypothetical protein